MKREQEMVFIQKIQRDKTLALALVNRARRKKPKRLDGNRKCGSLRCGVFRFRWFRGRRVRLILIVMSKELALRRRSR